MRPRHFPRETIALLEATDVLDEKGEALAASGEVHALAGRMREAERTWTEAVAVVRAKGQCRLSGTRPQNDQFVRVVKARVTGEPGRAPPSAAQQIGGQKCTAFTGALCVAPPIEAVVRNDAARAATSARNIRTLHSRGVTRCMCLTSFRIACSERPAGSHTGGSRAAKPRLIEDD